MGAKMYDINTFIKAGVPIPKDYIKYMNSVDQNGNIIKRSAKSYNLDYESMFNIVQNQNRIETLERYMWTNLPPGLTADIIERVLFYRGTGVIYFNDKVGRFQFLPYALNKTIDEYGRYTQCNTLPFTGVDEDKNNKKPTAAIYEKLPIVYDLPYNSDMIKDIRNKKAVGIILNDSSLALSQTPIIRAYYVQPILHLLSTVMSIINTAMYGSADYNLIQVDNESELEAINQAIDGINDRIIQGKRFGVVVGTTPITPLKTSSTFDIEGLFNIFNSLTNLLKSITGIANPGVFDKKAHLLQEEQQLNGSNADDIYYNGLRMRQEMCILFQAYYGYPMWCESKRSMSEIQAQNMATGETSDPDNTQYNDYKGDSLNASENK